jgi:group I intron endonuclease
MGQVYILRDNHNGKMYIGLTKRTLDKRFVAHRCCANKNASTPLYNSLRKYGEDSFDMFYIDVEFDELLGPLETALIEIYNTIWPNGYNFTTGGESGFKMSEASRMKMSKLRKGVPLSEQHKKNISKSNSGVRNAMFNRTPYDVWLEKYGKEEADKRLELWRRNHSHSMSGSKNPMSGKSLHDVWIKKYGEKEADRKESEWKCKISRPKYENAFFLKNCKELFDSYEDKIIRLLVDEKVKKAYVMRILGVHGKIEKWIAYYIFKGSLIKTKKGHRTIVYERPR